MRFGVIGLGRMGESLAAHAVEKGHSVVGFDPGAAADERARAQGIEIAASVPDMVEKLAAPRIVMLYVPHGPITEDACQQLLPLLAAGDIVADGGNSHWSDSIRRHEAFAQKGIRFLDVGTSGGVSGARNGACFMAGGDRDAYDAVQPILTDLAVDAQGVYYAGPPGTGHFAKLIHNAIEFGMVQAIGEGVELLQRSGFPLDLPSLFTNWMHGSVIRSWLVELMGKALKENPSFEPLSTYVEDTGEVKWVVDWAMDNDIPTPVVTTSQIALLQYRDLDSAQAKAVALLRNQYGGHPVHKSSERARQ